jgi:quercetin dioxygenase-like cupin family protein
VNDESAGQRERGTASEGIILGPGEGYTIPGTDTITLKATSEETGGSIGFLEATGSPGYGPPRHIHRSHDELFYVLEGEFIFLVGERQVSAPPGTFVFIPRGTVHAAKGIGTEPCKVQGGLHTGGLGALLRGVRSVAHRARRRCESEHGARQDRGGDKPEIRLRVRGTTPVGLWTS